MWQLKSNDLNKDRLLLEESLFSIGNGYIGIRGCLEEAPELLHDSIRGSYINGYYDRVPIIYSESAYGFPKMQDKQPKIMDTQTSYIYLDGEKVDFEESKIKDYNRLLDFQKGFSERGYKYITKSGKEGSIVFRRLASFAAPNILCYEISVQYDGEIEIVSVLNSNVSNHSDVNDPRVAAGNEKLLTVKKLFVKSDLAFCEMETITSKVPILSVVDYEAESQGEKDLLFKHNLDGLKISATVAGKKNIRLQKKCFFIDGFRADNLYQYFTEIYDRYENYTFSNLLEMQQAYLYNFWKSSDIEIYGDESIQKAVRFQLFQLLQSVGKDEISNISAKGLTGEGYEGHYFWDTEIYVLPLLQLTQPKLAKQLLLYRYHILPFAKQRAGELGHKKGAAYPWRTISGIECSSYFPAGSAQYHINADIAYSFIQYYLYHNDKAFMLEAAAEVIFETARIWLEIGHWYKDAFHIDSVTGPDEYTAIVNNNFYTNAMAKYHLYWASKLYHELQEYDPIGFNKLCQKIGLSLEEINEMKRASDAMYLLFDKKLGIHAQDDSFLQKAKWDFEGTRDDQYPLLLHFHPLTIYRYQVLKQPDTVLAHFLLEQYADFMTIKKSYDYYENITTHDSSLSSCIYGIMASRCGYAEKAYEYFLESIRVDLQDSHGNTKDGLHMANLAGCCLGIINGFAGFRIKETGISIAPIVPEPIEGYCFKVQYLGSMLEIKVREEIKIELLHGAPTKIKVYDNEYVVENSLNIERK